jgi:glutathione S-transferase
MEKIFPLYSKLEKFLGDRKFVSGENLTYVDFIVYEIEDKLRCFCHETFAKFPKLVNHFNTVSELPAIHAYRTS